MLLSSDAFALLLAAETQFSQGHYEEAVALLRRALEVENSPILRDPMARRLLKTLLAQLRPHLPPRAYGELRALVDDDEEAFSPGRPATSMGPGDELPGGPAVLGGGTANPGATRANGPSPALARSAGDTPEPTPEPLRRTPHLQWVDQPTWAPATTFEVEVWADQQAADAGAVTEEIVVEAPSSQREFRFRVLLVASSHCDVVGVREQELLVQRDVPSSARLRFTLKVNDPASATEEAYVSAIFLERGRPCGSVKLPLPLGPGADAMANTARDRGHLQTEPTAQLADLNVLIAADGPNRWRCRVSSPLLESLRDGISGPWELQEGVAKIVLRGMDEFMNGKTNVMRAAALKGAGRSFFDASPPVFQQAYWQLIDAGKAPKSLALVSEEAYLPWELMMPTRRRPGAGTERRPALGVEMAIGRWTNTDFVAPPQRIPLHRGFVVCPTDSGLTEASQEAELVLKTLPEGQKVVPANAEKLDQTLGENPPSLLHFICHGISDDAKGGQQLTLEGREAVTTNVLQGLDGVLDGLQQGRPLVFLNACQVGRMQVDLVKPGGFAEVFMREGASAVVAALWSVEDTVASEIAEVFYEELRQGKCLADILRRQRAKAYEGDARDTYAAYCFYGDPLAVGVIL